MRTKAIALCLAVSGMLVSSVGAQDASDARSPDAIIQAINDVEMPKYDAARRASEEGYLQEYYAQRAEAQQKQAKLIGELYEADPDNAALVRYMPMRWNVLGSSDPDAMLAEMDRVMERHDGELAIEAAYASANLTGRVHRYEQAKFMPALKRFREMAPEDDRAARLMMGAARMMEDEDALAMYKLALEEFPDSRSTKYAPGKIRQIKMKGKPFEFEFKDAISGATVSSKELRGKVLVIDFWATWCGPCIAEMPHMKKLYSEYADKGVEFIGISLDQSEDKGGLEKLRTYCEENDIEWPQYYQGNYWDSEFSTSWGINSIPTMFVIDKKGNLHSTEARGKLDKMIPELLGLGDGGAG